MLENKIAIVSSNPKNISNYMIALKGLVFDFWYFYSIDDLILKSSKQDIPILILDLVDCDTFDESINKIIESKKCNIEDIVVIFDDGVPVSNEWLGLGVSEYISLSKVKEKLALTIMSLFGEQSKVEYAISDVQLSIQLNEIANIEQQIIIKKSLAVMKNNLQDIKTINDLVIAIKESDKNINQSFLDVFNETFSGFLRLYKMEKAKNMLSKTRYSIIKIASSLGYSSAANFSTAFKSVQGISPSEYRKKSRFGNVVDLPRHKLFKY